MIRTLVLCLVAVLLAFVGTGAAVCWGERDLARDKWGTFICTGTALACAFLAGWLA